MVCPECGADLAAAARIRIGHRRKDRLALTIGIWLLLMTAGGGGAMGWGIAKGFDFNPYKPLWMLRKEATIGTANNPQRRGGGNRNPLAAHQSQTLEEPDRRRRQGGTHRAA